jgi:putative hydroxymethylpyrimidine transport system substrate-binding protein
MGGDLITPRRALLACATLLAALTIALSACGEKEESLGSAQPEPFDLALDFYVNPDHAGIYTAIENGYFERAGLEVNPRVPSDPSAPIKEVAAGRADLAVSYEPEVLLAKDQGLDVEAVAALVDEPLTSLISLPAGAIAKPADLKGKTVATAGIPYQSDYLETVLGDAGLSLSDVQEVNVGLNLLPALLGGKAQAILGGFKNVEGVDLAQRGKSPAVVPVDQLGVPTYDELVLVAKRSTVEDDPDSIRLFLGALAHGTADAIANPEAATKAILEAGQGLDPRLTRAEIDATLPLLAPAQGQPFGRMDPEKWELFASWMADHDLISDVPSADEVLTNEFLPPAAETQG